MKLARLCLAAVCILGFTGVAQASDQAVPATYDQLGFETSEPAAAVEPQAAPEGGCEVAATFAVDGLGGQEPIPQAMACGACSSSNCVGAPRGQICHTGQGWGHCNIYSGGWTCSTGGWECQCGSGPLP